MNVSDSALLIRFPSLSRLGAETFYILSDPALYVPPLASIEALSTPDHGRALRGLRVPGTPWLSLACADGAQHVNESYRRSPTG